MTQPQIPFLAGRPSRAWQNFAELRNRADLRSAAYVIPPPASQTLGGNQAQAFTLYLRPGAYIVGFAGTSQMVEGFAVKAIDEGTGAPLFSSWINFQNVSQPAAQFGIRFPMVLLPEPRLIGSPGSVGFMLQNLSANSNTIELLIHVAEPTQ